MKSLILAAAVLLLAACSAGVAEPTTATVVEVYEDKSPMGCIGTDWNTRVQLDDLRTDRICGKWGKPGDKVRGCWVSGASDGYANGFKLNCRGAQ